MDNKRVGVGFGVMILSGGKILLGKRHHDPRRADSELHGEGTWTMPGGKLEFGESLETGATREVREETGITIDPNELKVIALNTDIKGDAHFITIGLLYEKTVAEPKVTEPDEITEWQWFSLDALPSPLFFPSAKIIRNFTEKTFYIREN